jgi:ribose 5-phosphate isomerase B
MRRFYKNLSSMNKKPRILISSDHAGFELKTFLITALSKEGYQVHDFGPKTYDPEDDYPEFISHTALAISEYELAKEQGEIISQEEGDEDDTSGKCECASLDTQGTHSDSLKEERCQCKTEIKGIIIGGSGQGEAMAANRYARVRATVYYGGSKEIITLSREHNDANILSLGARFVSHGEALDAIHLWLSTNASNDPKYARRIQEVESLSHSNLFE